MTISDTACSIPKYPPKLRYLNSGDVPQLSEIDGLTYIFGQSLDFWSTKRFMRCFSRSGCAPPVLAEEKGNPQGFMLYRSKDEDCFEIVRLAVDPTCKTAPVISTLVNKLIGKLTPNRRNHITFKVSDVSDNIHRDLKSNGFRCTQVLRNCYKANGIYRDAYWFEYRLAG